MDAGRELEAEAQAEVGGESGGHTGLAIEPGGIGAFALGEPLDARRILLLQRTIGNAQTARLLRQQQQQQTAPSTDVLPAPVSVTWSSDPFEVSFERQRRFGEDRFVFVVRYAGKLKTTVAEGGNNSVRLGVEIDSRAVSAIVLGHDTSSLTVDLYGDGSKVLKLVDEGKLMLGQGAKGRTHDLDVLVDGSTESGTSMSVFDTKASAEQLTQPVGVERPEEWPGTFSGLADQRFGFRIAIDGDGDQDKELELRFTAIAPGDKTAGSLAVRVDGVQRSTGVARSATLVCAGAPADAVIFPVVEDVTDGSAPTRIGLVSNQPSLVLDVLPGVHSLSDSRYRLELGSQSADLIFPPDPRPRRKIAQADTPVVAAGITAIDVALGAYGDRFRLTFRQLKGHPIVFGITALLIDGAPSGTVGAELKLAGPPRPQVVESGQTSLGIDVDGDGAADLRLFDRLTQEQHENPSYLFASARHHRLRVTGAAIGGETTFDFVYDKGGGGVGGASSSELDKEAARNAEAVSILSSEQKAGGLSDQLDQVELTALAARRRAVDKGMLRKETYDALLRLWRALVAARAQLKAGVTAAAQNEAADASRSYIKEYETERGGLSMGQRLTVAMITAAITNSKWAVAFDHYASAMTDLDDLLQGRLESKFGKVDFDERELERLGATRRALRQIPDAAMRIVASFHPAAKFTGETGYVSAIPLQMYVWRDGDDWQLRDVTNPNKTFDYSAPAGKDEATPSLALFKELDDIDHFPAGVVYWSVPGGISGQTAVRDQLTWKQAFTYLGLGLAAIGVTLATAGAGTPVAAAAVYAFTASALAGAVAAGIDLGEHIKRNNLDATTAVLDVAQIVAGVAGGGAMAAGRVIKVAGTAPAAARFAGNWAKVAALSQQAYVPLTITTGLADVTTVAVMGIDAAKQLDEIDSAPGDEADKRRAKMLLLSQLALVGGLTALSLKGTISLGRGQTLVITPGPEGIPVASRAVGGETVIIDANVAIALKKRAQGIKLQPGEEALLERFDAVKIKDVRISDTTAEEAAVKGGMAPEHGFALSVDRAGAEYKAVLTELENANVGAAKGKADRQIVADAFFAVTETGVTPKLATMDPGVYNKLYTMSIKGTSQTPLNKMGKTLPEFLADKGGTFNLTINGRTLTVLPLPKK